MENHKEPPQNGNQAREIYLKVTLNPETLLCNIEGSTPNVFMGLSMARLLVDEFEHRARLAFLTRDKSNIELARAVPRPPITTQ